MNASVFRVSKAGPFISFQDAGRTGNLRYGVPASGPMDKTSFTSANLALGNSANATCVEVSLGGLELVCEQGELTLAIVGSGFVVALDGEEVQANCVLSVRKDQTLLVRPGGSGSWCYVAFAGRVAVPSWIDSTATHALSGFGGGVLTPDMRFTVERAELRRNREGNIKPFGYRPFDGYARVVLGPQEQHFSSAVLQEMIASEFKLTSSYDRMGVRLQGPKLAMKGSLSIPSEPLMRGSVQVAGDGVATILMADHQTTGGYPKIATIVSADHDTIAQLRPNDSLRFKPIDAEQAIQLARVQAIELRNYFQALA